MKEIEKPDGKEVNFQEAWQWALDNPNHKIKRYDSNYIFIEDFVFTKNLASVIRIKNGAEPESVYEFSKGSFQRLFSSKWFILIDD